MCEIEFALQKADMSVCRDCRRTRATSGEPDRRRHASGGARPKRATTSIPSFSPSAVTLSRTAWSTASPDRVAMSLDPHYLLRQPAHRERLRAAARTRSDARALSPRRSNPKNANAPFQMGEAEQAARTLGVQMGFVKASSEDEIETVFERFKQQRTDALLILSNSFLNRTLRIAELALMDVLPTCFAYREPAAAGGLMSYGANPTDSRQKGVYAGRILHGERPADLPVQQPTRFEFVINMKTAKSARRAQFNSITRRRGDRIETLLAASIGLLLAQTRMPMRTTEVG